MLFIFGWITKVLRSTFYSHCSWLLGQKYSLLDAQGQRLSNQSIGDIGERIACHYVKANGAKVLFRNYRGPKGGEVDVVVRDGKQLCFVEVKTRSYKSDKGRPMDAVDAQKREYVIRGAHAWLDLLPDQDLLWRYDVVEVIIEQDSRPDVNWVKQAFVESP